MKSNAYLLSWTLNNYERLLAGLGEAGFSFLKEADGNARVDVPFFRFKEFQDIVQPSLNAPFNYVDIQYPEEEKVVIIFGARTFIISNARENAEAKKWAIDEGLPTAQADWSSPWK